MEIKSLLNNRVAKDLLTDSTLLSTDSRRSNSNSRRLLVMASFSHTILSKQRLEVQ
jgi:hypothetical protein